MSAVSSACGLHSPRRGAPPREPVQRAQSPLAKAPPLAARPSPLRSAFTLIEIMIAIGIFSLVLAAIYSSWTAILRASKTGLEVAAAVQRSRIAVRMLEDSLGSAQSF